MKIENEKSGGATIVRVVEGDLDHTVCHEFQRQVNLLVSGGPQQFILDLGNVQFMDSMGIGTLITLRNKIMKEKGGIALCNLTDRVRKIIDLAALHKVFEVCDTVEAALSRLHKAS